MSDPRYRKLAEILVGYSTSVREGDKVLIESVEVPYRFVVDLVRVVREAGAHPLVLEKSQPIKRALMMSATPEMLDLQAASEELLMKGVDAYIGLRGGDNVAELSDVPNKQVELYESLYLKRVHFDIRITDTRWVVLRWPNASMAQLADRSTEAFEDFYFKVCTMDYERMSRALVPLQELMEKTDRVRLVAPGTDLTFSIAGIPAVPCDGERNIPDGEVFTAPVRDSIQGTIQYNTPTIYQGVSHSNVRLVFRDGKIVEATSSNNEHLNRVLDSDEGARYVGEFAIGFNPHITEPMKDILFDEKIAGSIHLTPGNAYDDADNGNRSQVHWDLILMMNEDKGGGEVWFDDVLIRKDGLFVLPELEGLNPAVLGS